ncbi:MAG: hypothetical protein EBQ94_11480 [Flavobacteriales bacterium]|nr:hypothetical protein [Flavobacteriales bacterium]
MQNKNGVIVIEGHVQGLANLRTFGEKGIPVWLVDKTDCIARYSKYCKNFSICPSFETDEFASFLIELCKENNLKDWLLIPSNDHAVYTISKHKTALEKYFKLFTSDLSVIENIYDKGKLIQKAIENDVIAPKTYFINNEEEFRSTKFDFPLLVKGKNGLNFYKNNKTKVYKINNQYEFETHLKELQNTFKLSDLLIQELIPFKNHKTISFAAFCINGEIKSYWCGVKLREHPIEFGTATLAKSINAPELLEPSLKIINALNYNGICEIEYLFDTKTLEFKLIEINARTWLWVELAKKSGVDLVYMAYCIVNQLEVNFPKSYKQNNYWINPITDLVFSMVAISKGKLSPFVYLKSLLTFGKTNALFRLNDPKPGFAYFKNLFAIKKQR